MDGASTSVGSGDSSCLSSTPIIALKQKKQSKGKEFDGGKAPKTTGTRPRGRPRKATKAKATEEKSSNKTNDNPARETTAKKSKDGAKKTLNKRSNDKESNKTLGENNDAKSPSTRAKRGTKKQEEEEKVKKANEASTDDSESEEEEEEAACCLCHCGVDCSDRALFFPKDRKLELGEDEDYYFSLDDPYMDNEQLYDRNNTLVYCDTCNRLYHQKCHFVPILVIPRGEFHCLICTIQQQQQQKQKRPSKKRERKGSIKSASNQPPAIPEKFMERTVTDQLFQSTPNESPKTAEILSLEKELELVSGAAKARTWDRQFKQVKTFLKSQASNIRMAKTTLATMTSTKRNRQHFLESSAKTGTKSSQELAQTLCKLTGAKFKIREALLSLERLRTNTESIDFQSLYAWCEENPQHASHVFPYGSDICKDGRRIVPRTRERKKETAEESCCGAGKRGNKKATDMVPNQIVLNGSTTKRRGNSKNSVAETVAKSSKSQNQSKRGEKKNTRKDKQKEDGGKKHGHSDDDSGITLDDLQCSICMIGDATDDNDVILCDGKDCHRAYHMKCVYPAVKPEDIENEDEDWFCPICSNVAELMGEIHEFCVGDDGDDDNASSGSWEDVHDVFPDSRWEFETATKYLKGKRNEDTHRLLAVFLGEDINKSKVQMPIGSDSEDENDYSLFDEESFQERRRQEREDESMEEDSVCSSQVTLQEMDDVDLRVGKAELAALSDEEQSDSGDSDDESETKTRRSRRLVKKEGEDSKTLDTGADFDEANIIVGKRKRTRVNYRKLNDMMFGDLTDHQQGLIDGGDDFDTTNIKPTKSDPDDQSENEESDNNESDNDGSDNDE
mmetsp:Transcript_13278/g.37375  ORF Transcript_13278/g.37375 Transcript_13278/m.37375 type:complete len:845 (-) Transcript_13278:173-2707(-)